MRGRDPGINRTIYTNRRLRPCSTPQLFVKLLVTVGRGRQLRVELSLGGKHSFASENGR
jgi:hypothetical protein